MGWSEGSGQRVRRRPETEDIGVYDKKPRVLDTEMFADRERRGKIDTMEKASEMVSIRMTPSQKARIESFAERFSGGNAKASFSQAVRHLIDRGFQMEDAVNRPSIAPGKNGDVVEFRSEAGARRYSVRQAPFRAIPYLVVFDADSSLTAPLENALGVAPLLDDVVAFIKTESGYSWSTPRYRDLCARLGLDPDAMRPIFSPVAEEVGEALIAQAEASFRSGAHFRAAVFFDVIDLLRIDAPPTAHAVWKAESTLAAEVSETDPAYALLSRALALVDRDHLAKPAFQEAVTQIRFLPSAEGRGYLASINGGGSTSDAEGWEFDMHEGLTGVALIPDDAAPWARTAMEKLSGLHGVTFLNADEARDYMKGDGAYWAEFHERSGERDVEGSARAGFGKIGRAVQKAVGAAVRRIA